MSDLVGKQLGNYRLLRHLGQGGFADVYLGEHRKLKTQAAIKVISARLSHEDVQEFLREAQTIAALKHPHIVRILDFSEENNTPFLVMEYASQGTLRQRHPRSAIVPLSTIVAYVRQVSAALQYAHDQKIIHQDVKPENMLIGDNGEILLSDFGIATIAHSTSSMRTQKPSGTPLYMAPEQWSGKPRPASDQYALGIAVFTWLCGALPFTGNQHALPFQHQEVMPAFDQSLHIPPPVAQVVLKALAKDPGQRFPTIERFAAELEQATQSVFEPTLQPPVADLPATIPAPADPTDYKGTGALHKPASLSATPAPTPVKRKRSAKSATAQGLQTPPTVAAPAPDQAASPPDLDALYREGVKARTQGDPERAASLWQQILDNDPHYGNDLLSKQIKELLPLRIQKYREQAEDAHRHGIWDQEIQAWERLLQLQRGDTQARARLSVANKNKQSAWMYENARQFVKEGDLSSAIQQLRALWQAAPYYGDPLDLTEKVGLEKPLNYTETQSSASYHRLLREQREEARIAGFGSFCLLTGLGSTAGFLVNARWHTGNLIMTLSWAIASVVLIALLSFLAGYRKGISPLGMAGITLISAAVAAGFTWHTWTFDYAHPQMIQVWLLGSRTFWLAGQVGLGLVLAAICSIGSGLMGGAVWEGNTSEQDDAFLELTVIIVGYVILWALVSLGGFLFNWSFGFGPGWYISLFYGLALGIVNGLGLANLKRFVLRDVDE